MKKLVRKVCSNIDKIEQLLIKYELEFTYIPDKIELVKENNEKVISELKSQLEWNNEILDILLKNN